MTLAFMKSGAAAHEEMERADLATAAAFGPQRFWLQKNETDARITFLDGGVVNGLIDVPVSFYEHMLPKGAGRKGFDNYCCTQELEACPICESGDTPSLVFAFTVIDHRAYQDRQGKTHQFQKRLFVCKRETFKRLQAKVAKLMAPSEMPDGTKHEPKATNGLIGVTFDVSRIGEKSAAVGSDFEFVACTPLDLVYEGCSTKPEERGPFKYDEVIKYFPAIELRKMGFGQAKTASVGSADTKAAGGETKVKSGSPFQAVGSKPFDPSKEL